MFSAAKFVVVDDKSEHLTAIVDTMRAIGSACLGVHYSSEVDPDPKLFRGVRGLFMDLQLVSNSGSTNFNSHFSVIQGLLEDVISADGGPFIMILWTDKPEQAHDLSDYLSEHIPVKKRHCVPVEVIGLSKTPFIAKGGSGEVSDAIGLESAVRERLSAVPSLSALMEWEDEIARSTGQVIADVLKLLPVPEAPSTNTNGADLARLLLRLAGDAVGQANVDRNNRANLQSVLMPMLSDRMYNLTLTKHGSEIWNNCLADEGLDPQKLSAESAGALNTQIHIDVDSDSTLATDWGSICEISDDFDWNGIGIENEQEFLDSYLERGINGQQLGIRPCQIRVGAACDYAQQSRGPIAYVLAGVLPAKNGSKEHGKPASSNHWTSPVLKLDGDLVQLVVDPKVSYVTSHSKASGFPVKGRIREQMLMDLIGRVAHHSSRPGIIRFSC